MRIALVIERFEPRGGGVEGVAWQVAHALATAGDEVHVVARRAETTDAVTLHRVSVPDAWQPLRVAAFSRAAARAAPRGAFDVVHSFSRTRHQDLYRAGGGSHADSMERQYGPIGRRLRCVSPRHALLLSIERRIFGDASQWVQCISRQVRDELARRWGIPDPRLVVIYNGVDLERFHPARRATDGAALRARYGAAGRPLWLFVASGWRRKGIDTALRALATGGPRDAELWVAGRDEPGPWRALASSLGVGERVRFLGMLDDPAPLYAAGDALLFPSRYDAFGNACAEALASGIPVVASGAAGASEVVGDGGIVVADPEDAGGFAAALDALADPAARRARGEAARRAAGSLSWPAHVEALRALYTRIGEARRRAGASSLRATGSEARP